LTLLFQLCYFERLDPVFPDPVFPLTPSFLVRVFAVEFKPQHFVDAPLPLVVAAGFDQTFAAVDRFAQRVGCGEARTASIANDAVPSSPHPTALTRRQENKTIPGNYFTRGIGVHTASGRVENRIPHSVGLAYLFPPLSSGGASLA
jgi:hypothetical protein